VPVGRASLASEIPSVVTTRHCAGVDDDDAVMAPAVEGSAANAPHPQAN
jgi:hypothetical protein